MSAADQSTRTRSGCQPERSIAWKMTAEIAQRASTA